MRVLGLTHPAEALEGQHIHIGNSRGKPLATITFYSSSTLFKIAKTAFQRTTGEQTERQGRQNDAIVAVIFAAAALEAFINELGEIAGDIVEQTRAFEEDVQRAGGTPSGLAPVPPFVGALTALIQQLEESKGQVQLKYDMALFLLRGEMYNHGIQPYQDFSDLIKLRNAILPSQCPYSERNTSAKGDPVTLRNSSAPGPERPTSNFTTGFGGSLNHTPRRKPAQAPNPRLL